MNEKEFQKRDEVQIDLQKLFSAVWHKAWLVVLVSVIFAGVAFAVTHFLITPMYQASAMFYVNNRSVSVGDASLSISSGDLVTSRNLVESYIVILNTRESLNDVIDYAGVDSTYREVKDMLSAAAVNETEIFQVVVTSPDPQEAEKIANAIAYILPKRITSIIEGTSAKVVEAAVVPSKPSSPSYTRNVMIGLLLGMLLTTAIIVLREMFDISIQTEEDIAQSCKHPVLAAIPDMAAPSKGGYDCTYDRKKKDKDKSSAASHGKEPVLIGRGISFAASEAYKLLRTKLQFSFTDDESNCRVIALSSALRGEGKSLTAVNLAYTLSQLDKRVILIDCDMRSPTLAEKLNIQKKPGLSGFLTGESSFEGMIQVKHDEGAFHVIAAGQKPPNPIELLSSDRMDKALSSLRKMYDYIILDLPSVGEVSDAMAVANKTDGILLVVRQNYCDRLVLSETAQQFGFIDAKILGVVFNCTAEGGGKYGKGYYKKCCRKYRKYGKYSERYYRCQSYAGARENYENEAMAPPHGVLINRNRFIKK